MAPSKKSQFNGYNFFVCFLVSLGQIAFGYPASIIGTTLGEPPFLIYMGLIDPLTGKETGNAEALIGAMNGVFQAGAVIGILTASYIMDHFGRKAGVLYCSLFSLFGGALLCGSQNVAMFIGARFIAGWGSWGFLAVRLRGFFVGMNGVNIALGYALASYMGMAFYFADNETAKWRGPLGLALLWPFMMIAVVCVVPESPRFLLMKGEVEKARDIVYRIHKIKGDPTKKPGWWAMFTKKGYRRRTALAMGFAFIGQSTGVLVINNYGPSLYATLGYGTKQQLEFQCGWITVGIVFNAVGAMFMDKVGRKPLMLFGVGGCCVCLILEAALVASFAEEATNKAGLAAGVGKSTMEASKVYSMGVDVAGVVFYSELFPNHIRAKGVCLSMATVALTDLVYLQATTTAFANIGWKFYLIFIIITFFGTTLMFFLLPETKGIPLEEMAKIFGDTEDVVVFSSDLHIDQNTHELVVTAREGKLEHVATHQGVTPEIEKQIVEHRERATDA
ncbi:general substrate transporter [Lindgomyces ingoldianus]|uniref:General substrate transporter n=1 Tax=Lindgomyces ingoldianus TaxID=673940 RepID=A0ACB6QRK8_9PLEO|nr:general substrate transporter [Lindgomyces ingoldianus]KAF2469502.1 general substrate transporter [Lindgomyces ingoldianus]